MWGDCLHKSQKCLKCNTRNILLISLIIANIKYTFQVKNMTHTQLPQNCYFFKQSWIQTLLSVSWGTNASYFLPPAPPQFPLTYYFNGFPKWQGKELGKFTLCQQDPSNESKAFFIQKESFYPRKTNRSNHEHIYLCSHSSHLNVTWLISFAPNT